MSMDSDIKSVTIVATGTAVNHRTRLRGIYYHTGGGAGTLTFNDNTNGQIVTWTFNANETGYQLLPGRGLLFNNMVSCTAFTNMTSVTLFYEG